MSGCVFCVRVRRTLGWRVRFDERKNEETEYVRIGDSTEFFEIDIVCSDRDMVDPRSPVIHETVGLFASRFVVVLVWLLLSGEQCC